MNAWQRRTVAASARCLNQLRERFSVAVAHYDRSSDKIIFTVTGKNAFIHMCYVHSLRAFCNVFGETSES